MKATTKWAATPFQIQHFFHLPFVSVPPAPTGIVATGRTYSRIYVGWDAVNHENVLGYLVFYRMVSHPQDIFKVKPALNNSVELVGLEAKTQYIMRVAAYSNEATGIASEETFASTLATGNVIIRWLFVMELFFL